ncbi:hypothetical protein ACFFX0_26865 [Citricoccus parietis]|uniref:Uncharacterized protein n=1 Tax=Citricoccus parietis TaxID=592307 RepID=A0ABV5G6P2_9MICC
MPARGGNGVLHRISHRGLVREPPMSVATDGDRSGGPGMACRSDTLSVGSGAPAPHP